MARTRNTKEQNQEAVDAAVTKPKVDLNEELAVTAAASSIALGLEAPENDAHKKAMAENAALSVEDKPEAKKDEAPKKEPLPKTAVVAAAWIRSQLEDGPKTKEQLAELAKESNPAKFENPKGKDRPKVPRSTKWIAEHKKIGQMCPGNASGYYVAEGLDVRSGGLDVLIDEESKELRLK